MQELCGVERDSGWVVNHFRIVADCTAWLTGAGTYTPTSSFEELGQNGGKIAG